MLKSLSYDDVLLVPQFSDIKSRTEVSLDTDLTNGLRLNTPIISSPMDTVTEGAMATVMAVEGGTAIVHRYNDLTTQGKIVKSVVQQLGTDMKVNIGGAIGVSGDYIERATELINCGANFL